jgi:hypothetical protein
MYGSPFQNCLAHISQAHHSKNLEDLKETERRVEQMDLDSGSNNDPLAKSSSSSNNLPSDYQGGVYGDQKTSL